MVMRRLGRFIVVTWVLTSGSFERAMGARLSRVLFWAGIIAVFAVAAVVVAWHS